MLCPNCNNSLPDNSVACNFCGYSFQNAQCKVETFSVSTKKGIRISFILSLIISVVGVLIAIVSVFPPFFEVEDMFNTLTENIFSPLPEITCAIWGTCGVIIGFSFAHKRCVQSFAITRLIMSIIGLGITIFLAYKLREFVDRELDMSTVYGNVSFNYSAGFYLMLAGFILCVVSAIISLAAGSDK